MECPECNAWAGSEVTLCDHYWRQHLLFDPSSSGRGGVWCWRKCPCCKATIASANDWLEHVEEKGGLVTWYHDLMNGK